MLTVGLLGLGAINSFVVDNWSSLAQHYRLISVLGRPARLAGLADRLGSVVQCTDDADVFVRSQPDLVVEAAGHQAVRDLAPRLLQDGREVYVLSIGALADDALHARLTSAAVAGGGRLKTPPGALAGFDGLLALRVGGLTRLRYRSSKPCHAWEGTPAEVEYDLTSLAEPMTIFIGSARNAARLYPRNANLAAAVAFAGRGLDDTEVELIADPWITSNIGEIDAEGPLGSLKIRVDGAKVSANPKTSEIVGASIISSLLNRAAELRYT